MGTEVSLRPTYVNGIMLYQSKLYPILHHDMVVLVEYVHISAATQTKISLAAMCKGPRFR